MVVFLIGCVSAEEKAENNLKRQQAVQIIEDKIPLMLSALEKACFPFLDQMPVGDLFDLMEADGYSGSLDTSIQKKLFTEYKILTNTESKLQIQLQTKSQYDYNCIVIAETPEISLTSDNKSNLRKKIIGGVKTLGEKYAQNQGEVLKKSYGNNDFNIGPFIAPKYGFKVPVTSNVKSLAIVATRYPQRDTSELKFRE